VALVAGNHVAGAGGRGDAAGAGGRTAAGGLKKQIPKTQGKVTGDTGRQVSDFLAAFFAPKDHTIGLPPPLLVGGGAAQDRGRPLAAAAFGVVGGSH